MELKWAVLVLMGALLSICNSLNWMAGGPFTQANFDYLRSKVAAFDPNTDPNSFADWATTTSNDLNNKWASAWNVVTIYYYSGSYDAVVYGYAFNGQWFWQNGLALLNGG